MMPTVILYLSRVRPLRALWQRLVSHRARESFHRRLVRRQSDRKIKNILSGSASSLESIERVSVKHAESIDQPLVLISQLARSGGSLLSQLFDAHPQCFVHPDELKIGKVEKFSWPDLDLNASPEDWFRALIEPEMADFFLNGYWKGQNSRDRLKCIFVPRIQKQIFLDQVARRGARTRRQILDCYMTSFFGAWLDYQHGVEPKQAIVAFAPMMALEPVNVDRFFDAYPDGWLLSVFRDPIGWYQSARHHVAASGWFATPEDAAAIWNRASRALLANTERYPRRTRLIAMDRLVDDTEQTMRNICDLLGLEFSLAMLKPTFNGRPVAANSSFEGTEGGIVRAVTTRKASVDVDTQNLILEKTGEIYDEIRRRAERR